MGVGAGAGICLELEPEISKMGGSGNPAYNVVFSHLQNRNAAQKVLES